MCVLQDRCIHQSAVTGGSATLPEKITRVRLRQGWAFPPFLTPHNEEPVEASMSWWSAILESEVGQPVISK